MEDELKVLTGWLERDLTHFVALVVEGSLATGDPWQEGYSDCDLHVVVAQDIDSEIRAIYNWLEENPLGDKYLVTPRLINEYLVGDNTIHDLSLKFRSKTAAGRDVVSEKRLPDREQATNAGQEGLKHLKNRLERRWLNNAHWSDEHARHQNYPIYKNFFMFYAAMHYGQTGEYPKNRANVSMFIDNQEWANNVLKVTDSIGNSSKSENKLAIESAIKIIDCLNL